MGTPLRIAAVAAVLLVTGCGSSGGGDKSASQATPEATPEATAEVTIAAAQEAGRVRRTTKSFFAALVNGHGDRACAMLEQTNRRAIPQLAARRGLPVRALVWRRR